MAARLVMITVGVLTVSIPSGWASETGEPGGPEAFEGAKAVAVDSVGAVSASGVHEAIIEPIIISNMPRKTRERLVTSYRVAVERVREVPECREMFTELGADGLQTLDRISFYPIGIHEVRLDVCRGSWAHTLVGGGPIWVCRQFSRLSDTEAAMIIIHEALHHAGLTEHPLDANGMTSSAINRMVVERCGL